MEETSRRRRVLRQRLNHLARRRQQRLRTLRQQRNFRQKLALRLHRSLSVLHWGKRRQRRVRRRMATLQQRRTRQ